MMPSDRATILVVEDELSILRAIESTLAEVPSYKVLCAQTAEDGLRIAGSRRNIHLLIANVVLPGMLGTQLATKIKAQRPRMRVILIDGKGNGKLAVLGLAAGWEVLRQPRTGAALLERVKADLVGAREIRRTSRRMGVPFHQRSKFQMLKMNLQVFKDSLVVPKGLSKVENRALTKFREGCIAAAEAIYGRVNDPPAITLGAIGNLYVGWCQIFESVTGYGIAATGPPATANAPRAAPRRTATKRAGTPSAHTTGAATG